ncbi:MAG: 30S ribosomal protein S3 [Dehalococcoidia bacterium]|nr:30S ribosomal protein S3 [Dehalococcoidia bacterium]MDW8119305.1 30S ribosomal protein S3 [Chloroflexota bacterium]
MGHKTHPIGFRLGVGLGQTLIKDWQTHWFAPKGTQYRQNLLEDLRIRHAIAESYGRDAAISKVEIERDSQQVRVTIHTARPGVVIGRDGKRIRDLGKALEALTTQKVKVDVKEIEKPELEALLVARSVAEQLEKRVGHRRAMLQAATRAMQAGARGVKIAVAGRLGGAEIARREKVMMGRLPLHTIRADVDFAVAEALTIMGRIGVKVWIYRGDVLPPSMAEAAVTPEEARPIQVTIPAEATESAEGAE